MQVRPRLFPYHKPAELSGTRAFAPAVIIVGAGPVGLALAIDLALHDIACTVIDANDVVAQGSRAICWSKRSLEIFNRLGIGRRMREKGVTWQVGRVFRGDSELYSFDLQPEPGHEMPAFINLQQYYVEEYLIARAGEFSHLIDLRWKSTLIGVQQHKDGVVAKIKTPDGVYTLEAPYLIACDGARSTVRRLMGLEFVGQAFEERFLIADVEMTADFPSERHFWFEPSFHPGQSALIHKQPDNIYRIDFQLGPDVDPEEEAKPEKVIPRVKAAIGNRPFTLNWVSIYRFQCRRLERFVHGRVIFAGDAAHIVSPFGARGGNGGIQDGDNLAWKLAATLNGAAGSALLASYDEERCFGADENILNSARTTTFMTPKSRREHHLRTAVLDLAKDHGFARGFVNSGRLSLPCSLAGLSLQTPTPDGPGLAPGTPCPDVPVASVKAKSDFLLRHLGGDFALLTLGHALPLDIPGLRQLTVGLSGELQDCHGLVKERYGEALSYLIRPDQHIAARFVKPSPLQIEQALKRALGGA